jgi:hypothetical protein
MSGIFLPEGKVEVFYNHAGNLSLLASWSGRRPLAQPLPR